MLVLLHYLLGWASSWKIACLNANLVCLLGYFKLDNSLLSNFQLHSFRHRSSPTFSPK